MPPLMHTVSFGKKTLRGGIGLFAACSLACSLDDRVLSQRDSGDVADARPASPASDGGPGDGSDDGLGAPDGFGAPDSANKNESGSWDGSESPDAGPAEAAAASDAGAATVSDAEAPDASQDATTDAAVLEDGDALPDPTPRLVSFAPTGVVVDGRTPIVVVFSASVRAAPSSITVLLDDAAPIAGTTSVSGSTLTFVPSSILTQPGTYRVVAKGVTDVDGNAIQPEPSFTFSIPAEGDGDAAPSKLDTLGSEAPSCPSLVMDSDGNARVVFQQGPSVFAAYYQAGRGWQPTVLVAQGRDAVLAAAPHGRAAIAYTATVSGKDRIVVRFANAGEAAFGDPTVGDEGAPTLPAVPGACDLHTRGKAIAINDQGSAVLSWHSTLGTTPPEPQQTSNLYVPGKGWGTPTYVAQGYGDDHAPSAAIDSVGNAEIAWCPVTNAKGYRSRPYLVSSGWGSVVDWQGGIGPTMAPLVAVDEQDVFTRTVIRTQPSTPSALEVFAASVVAQGSASRPTLSYALTGAGDDVFGESLGGGMFVTWRNEGKLGIARLTSSDTAWQALTVLETASAANPNDPVIAGIAETREGILMWESDTGIRFAPFDALRAPPLPRAGAVSALKGATSGRQPRVVLDDASGHGIALWLNPGLQATSFRLRPGGTVLSN